MQYFTPYEYLKIDAANAFGLDKELWDTRIGWFDTNEKHLESLEAQADDIWAYRKAVGAVRDAQNHIPSGHIMGLDATASGYGIIACITGCYKTARKVNLVNTGKRECIYMFFSEHMSQVCGYHIPRDIVKEPVMTKVYNSSSKPKEIFGDGTEAHIAFNETLSEECPGAVEYLGDIQTLWDPTRDTYTWTTPDGHVARVKVLDVEDSRVEIDEIGVSFTHRCKVHRPIDFGLMLQANIVQSLDAWIDREMKTRAKKQGWELLSIFDDFRASPNNIHQMRQNYIDIMCELADSNILSEIISEIAGEDIQYVKLSDNLSDYIKESEYAIS